MVQPMHQVEDLTLEVGGSGGGSDFSTVPSPQIPWGTGSATFGHEAPFRYNLPDHQVEANSFAPASSPWADIRRYGAEGDPADDVGAVINAMQAAGIRNIFIPEGEWRVVTPIDISLSNTKLFGAGRDKSILRYDGASSFTVGPRTYAAMALKVGRRYSNDGSNFQWIGEQVYGVRNCEFAHFQIKDDRSENRVQYVGTNPAANVAHALPDTEGIALLGCDFSSFHDLHISNFDHGMTLRFSDNTNTFTNIKIGGLATGGITDGVWQIANVNHNGNYDGLGSGAANDNSAHNVWTGCHFLGYTRAGIYGGLDTRAYNSGGMLEKDFSCGGIVVAGCFGYGGGPSPEWDILEPLKPPPLGSRSENNALVWINAPVTYNLAGSVNPAWHIWPLPNADWHEWDPYTLPYEGANQYAPPIHGTLYAGVITVTGCYVDGSGGFIVKLTRCNGFSIVGNVWSHGSNSAHIRDVWIEFPPQGGPNYVATPGGFAVQSYLAYPSELVYADGDGQHLFSFGGPHQWSGHPGDGMTAISGITDNKAAPGANQAPMPDQDEHFIVKTTRMIEGVPTDFYILMIGGFIEGVVNGSPVRIPYFNAPPNAYTPPVR